MPRLRKPLIVLAAPLLGLGLAEGAVRLMNWVPPALPKPRGQVVREVADPVVQFVPLPDSSMWLHYREAADEPVRVVEMNVNAHGFRGPEVSREKPAGVFRIACLGDSHTFGNGVEDDETWPAHLQRRLAASAPRRRIEVLNCGVNGYDTVQEEHWLREGVLAFEPDLVLLQFYVNDAALRAPDGSQQKVRDFVLDLTGPRREDWVKDLRERSRFVDLVFDGMYRRRGLKVYSELRSRPYREEGAGWLTVRDSLLRIRDLLAEREIDFGFVLYPFLVRRDGEMTSREAFRIVSRFATENGIATLDAEPAFDGLDLDGLRISMYDYHGNARAHELFAGAVADWLEARGSLAAD